MKSLTQNGDSIGQREDGRTQPSVGCTELHMAGNASRHAIDHASVRSLSEDRPVLLVCLRHLGCAFAREALADLRAQRPAIEASGVRLALVHLESASIAGPILSRYGLNDVPAISDPSGHLYEACGLARGGIRELVGLRVLWRWFATAVLRRNGAGWTGGDVRRMPGAFLVERGRIIVAFRHRTSADRPDYAQLCARPGAARESGRRFA